MKIKLLYAVIIATTILFIYKGVNNANKKRGYSVKGSKAFIKNFEKLVGAKELKPKNEVDQEVNKMLHAASKVDKFQINLGDDKRICNLSGLDTNLEELKKELNSLKFQCRQGDCDEIDQDRLEIVRIDILNCITQNEQLVDDSN